jgi:hypothetical protein
MEGWATGDCLSHGLLACCIIFGLVTALVILWTLSASNVSSSLEFTRVTGCHSIKGFVSTRVTWFAWLTLSPAYI